MMMRWSPRPFIWRMLEWILHRLQRLHKSRRWKSISQTRCLLSICDIDALVHNWSQRWLEHISPLSCALDLSSSDHSIRVPLVLEIPNWTIRRLVAKRIVMPRTRVGIEFLGRSVIVIRTRCSRRCWHSMLFFSEWDLSQTIIRREWRVEVQKFQ